MLPPYKFKVVGQCWMWLGTWQRGSNENKYGKVYDGVSGQMKLVHRVMYEKYHGPIKSKHEVHHVCENTMCGNPAHLQQIIGTRHARMRRR